LEAADIRVIQLFPKNFDDTLTRIQLIGRITGAETRAGEIVSSMERRVAEVQRQVKDKPRVRVLYELDATDSARPWVAGGGAIYNEVIRLAGGENVFAAQKQPTLQVGAEQIIAANPDVILLGDMESPLQPQRPDLVRKRTGWARIAAVKNGRVFGVKSERITRPAPRFVEGLEEVAKRLAEPGSWD
jgi:iron complex transport system substrate-binding protein